MKKIHYYIIAAGIGLLAGVNFSLAAANNSNDNSNQNANGERNQIQEQTQNQGNSTQLQVMEQVNEQNGNNNNNANLNQNRNTNQVQNTNQAQNTNQLHNTNQTRIQTRIGDSLNTATQEINRIRNTIEVMTVNQVRTETQTRIQEVISTQIQAQNQIQTKTEAVENRSGFVKFFIGRDYGAIAKIRQHIEQNQLRIQEMQTLLNQTANAGELSAIQETIQTIEQENTSLQDFINEKDRGFSLLGWLFRWFS